ARHGVSTTGCPSIVDLFPDTLDPGSNPIRPVPGAMWFNPIPGALALSASGGGAILVVKDFSNSHAAPVPAPAPITDPIAAHTTHHLPPSGLETSRMIVAVTKPAMVPGPRLCWRFRGMSPAASPASAAPMMPTPSHTRSSIN